MRQTTVQCNRCQGDLTKFLQGADGYTIDLSHAELKITFKNNHHYCERCVAQLIVDQEDKKQANLLRAVEAPPSLVKVGLREPGYSAGKTRSRSAVEQALYPTPEGSSLPEDVD